MGTIKRPQCKVKLSKKIMPESNHSTIGPVCNMPLKADGTCPDHGKKIK